MKYLITENRLIGLLDKFIKRVNPKFNRDDIIIATYSNGNGTFLEYYSTDNGGKMFAKYYVWTRELVLNRELFHKLEDYFGEENMGFIIDWFNKEFDQEAETITSF